MTNKSRVIGAVSVIFALGAVEANAVEPYLPRAAKVFERIDVDKDGKLKETELKAVVMRRFKRLDANSDNAIGSDELQRIMQAAVDRRRLRITEAELDIVLDSLFNAADSDHDGALTIAETQGFKRGQWLKNMVKSTAN
jgi:Ca2+-binding EF-hand superfamily protein